MKPTIAFIFAVALSGCASQPAFFEPMEPTAVCGDGVLSYSPPGEGVCANHDGVRLRLGGAGHRPTGR
jgi:hypothetical protein